MGGWWMMNEVMFGVSLFSLWGRSFSGETEAMATLAALAPGHLEALKAPSKLRSMWVLVHERLLHMSCGRATLGPLGILSRRAGVVQVGLDCFLLSWPLAQPAHARPWSPHLRRLPVLPTRP